MGDHAEIIQENKSLPVSNTVIQKKRDAESTLKYADSGPEAIQRQEMADSSPRRDAPAQLQEMAEHSPRRDAPKQLQDIAEDGPGLKRGLRKQKATRDLQNLDEGIGRPTNIDSSESDYDPSTAIPLDELTQEDRAKINQRNLDGIDQEPGNKRAHEFSNVLSEEERPEVREKARMDKVKADYLLGQKLKEGSASLGVSHEEAMHYDALMAENEDKPLDLRDQIRLVDAWILDLARASNHEELISGPYSKLSIDKRIEVFKVADVDLNLDEPQTSKGLETKFISKLKPWKGKETSWNKFSLAIRKVGGNAAMVGLLSSARSESAGENPYADTTADKVEKGGGVGMVTAGVAGGVTKLATADGVGQIGLGGTVAGVVFSLNNILTLKRDSQDHELTEKVAKDGVKTLSEASNVLLNVTKSIGEISLMAQGQAGGVASMGSSLIDGSKGATSGAIQGGAGAVLANIGAITAIVKGALDIIQGSYEVIDATKIKAKLAELQKEMASPDFVLACQRAEETQSQRQVMGATMIASGAAMVAGGIILTAVALTNPVGWLLLTAAGIISLSAAIWKISKKGKAAKKFAKLIYNMQFGKEDDNVDDETLDNWLNTLGYANGDFASLHNEFMHGLGISIHSAAFGSEGERKNEARALLATIKLKINEDKKTPTAQVISKRLRNP